MQNDVDGRNRRGHESENNYNQRASQALLSEFKNIFSIKDKDFSFGDSILAHIDNSYPKLEKEGVGEAEMFYPIVAYCGEFLKSRVNGVWTSTVDDQGNVLIRIKGKDGKEYDPYLCVNKILTNGYKPYSFQIAIQNQLHPNGLKLATPAKNIPLNQVEMSNGKTLEEY